VTVIAPLGWAVAVGVMLLTGCGSTPFMPAGNPTPAASSSAPWSASCVVSPVIEPSGGGIGSGGSYTVTLTNETSDVQDASYVQVVFLVSGQEVESGTAESGPSQVLGGQTITISDNVPGANPNYGLSSEPMNAVNQCQVTSIGLP
jgi:hypothetical protein